MEKLSPNPFKFGDPVKGKFYLPRPRLENFITQFIENRIPIVLIGPRRMGKTSFVLNLLEKFEKQGKIVLFLDIFNITSLKDFLQQLVRSIRLKKGRIGLLKEKLSGIKPSLSLDVDHSTGNASFGVTFENSREKDVKDAIQDLFSKLAYLGEDLVFAIDEFQKVSEIDDQGWLEATIRTHMQQLGNTAFIFTGSRRSVIYDMLNNPKRPLYRFCQPIEFPVFDDEFTDWILERFSEVGVFAEKDAIRHLRSMVQDTPNYVQMVCFHLVAHGIEYITVEKVEAVLKIVVRQNAYAYQTLLNSLTPTQQRVLRLAAVEGKQIFSKELLSKYEIQSGAAMASAIKSLKDKELLDEEGGGKGRVIFDDPFFAIWLKNAFYE